MSGGFDAIQFRTRLRARWRRHIAEAADAEGFSHGRKYHNGNRPEDGSKAIVMNVPPEIVTRLEILRDHYGFRPGSLHAASVAFRIGLLVLEGSAEPWPPPPPSEAVALRSEIVVLRHELEGLRAKLASAEMPRVEPEEKERP